MRPGKGRILPAHRLPRDAIRSGWIVDNRIRRIRILLATNCQVECDPERVESFRRIGCYGMPSVPDREGLIPDSKEFISYYFRSERAFRNL
jgi:hypothetical protein